MINLIDHQNLIYDQEILKPNTLQDISIAELFWIYESLVKDFSWALTSLSPEKVVQVLLQKICLRRTILKGDDPRLGEVPQLGKSEAGEPEIKVAPKKISKNWDDFLVYLRNVSPATAANLENGNLIEAIRTDVKPLLIKIAFPENAAVFKDFLDEKETYARLKNHLADFFEMEIDAIEVKSQLLSDEEKKDKNFKTKVELGDEERKNREEQRRLSIVNDPYVKEAEKIFNSKIDKIILND
jgi:hypothetical protein